MYSVLQTLIQREIDKVLVVCHTRFIHCSSLLFTYHLYVCLQIPKFAKSIVGLR